jgi:hypothetical protein
MNARHHLDQRRLAGAILAQQGMHLALAHIERDAAQRPHAGERLDDAVEPQHRWSRRGRRWIVFPHGRE